MLKHLILSTSILVAVASVSSAQSFHGLQTEILTGPNAVTESWNNLTPTNYPTYPAGFASYPGGTIPNTVANVTPTAIDPATLIHVNGSSSPAFLTNKKEYYGIYNSSSTSQYRIQKDSAISGLETVGFLLESSPFQGGYFAAGGSPVLILNGDYTNGVFAADFSDVVNSGIITGDTTTLTQHYFQWDLSGYLDPIDSFAIEFTVVNHAFIMGLQVSQSDLHYEAAAIPEPSTYALIGAGLAGAALLRRRRRAA